MFSGVLSFCTALITDLLLVDLIYVTAMEDVNGYQLRSPLARAVYNRLLEDERHRNDKHEYWYRVDTGKLPADLCEKFVQFHQDEETSQFLQQCQEKGDWVFTQIYQSLARIILGWFMSKTSVNGLLGCGSMFVLSHQQFETLLGLSPVRKTENLIDLGAGDGEVTKKIAKYFSNVYTTEMSPSMINLLQYKGYRVLDAFTWDQENITYDLISCLNLLDRCDKPVSLLHAMHKVLRPGTGRVLVAVVIPFKPYVEFDSVSHVPTELLHISGTFEEQVSILAQNVFRSAGFEVESFTRVPYLCEGDLRHSFYVLTDAVFVLKAISS